MKIARLIGFLAILLSVALIIYHSIYRRQRTERMPSVTSGVDNLPKTKESTMGMTTATTNALSKPVKSYPKPGDSKVIEIEHGLRPLPLGKERPYNIRHAEHKGAQGKLTIHVVDVDGAPVDDADVYANFFTYRKDEQESIKKTDSNGRTEIEGVSCGDMWFSVTKLGYYETRMKYWFFKAGFDCVENGRWIPWNPILEVILKDVKKPITMLRHSARVYLPKSDLPIGFDCVEKDLVQPYGRGKVSDLFFIFSSVGGFQGRIDRHYTNELFISTGSIPGIWIEPHDNWCQLKSSHAAPQGGYSEYAKLTAKVFTPYRKDDVVDDLFHRGQHIVFRSRVVTNALGEIVSANYGKIYPPFVYGDAPPDKGEAGVAFTYSFNTNPNDPNLERKRESPHDGVL